MFAFFIIKEEIWAMLCATQVLTIFNSVLQSCYTCNVLLWFRISSAPPAAKSCNCFVTYSNFLPLPNNTHLSFPLSFCFVLHIHSKNLLTNRLTELWYILKHASQEYDHEHKIQWKFLSKFLQKIFSQWQFLWALNKSSPKWYCKQKLPVHVHSTLLQCNKNNNKEK